MECACHPVNCGVSLVWIHDSVTTSTTSNSTKSSSRMRASHGRPTGHCASDSGPFPPRPHSVRLLLGMIRGPGECIAQIFLFRTQARTQSPDAVSKYVLCDLESLRLAGDEGMFLEATSGARRPIYQFEGGIALSLIRWDWCAGRHFG
jgi:hypothetical protein